MVGSRPRWGRYYPGGVRAPSRVVSRVRPDMVLVVSPHPGTLAGDEAWRCGAVLYMTVNNPTRGSLAGALVVVRTRSEHPAFVFACFGPPRSTIHALVGCVFRGEFFVSSAEERKLTGVSCTRGTHDR